MFPADSRELAQMRVALQVARAGLTQQEVPVGAAVFAADGTLLATGANTRHNTGSFTGHAEITALETAAAKRSDRDLSDCTLAVTLEPCVMCAGVILASRVSKVIFGAWDAKAGACGSVYDLLRDGRLPHRTPEVIAEVLAPESAGLLQQFFAAKR